MADVARRNVAMLAPEPAQERGIDVALAIDFVDLAARKACDDGVNIHG